MTLPDIILEYFDAANLGHASDASKCFTSDAIVHDEDMDYVGRDDIRSWIEETTEKYSPQFHVLQAEERDDGIALMARVSGDFPGSPVDLEYDITMRDDKISSLTIQ